MKERSAFDILIENLVDLGYKPETSVSHKTFVNPTNRFLNQKYVLCSLPNNIFFLASDYFGTSVGSSTFTGLYSSINLHCDAEYKVMKKDWLDFIYRKRKKTGIEYIDKILTILSLHYIPSKELSKRNVELFLELSNKDPYHLIVENDYIPQIQELKGAKTIGIETNGWIYQKDDLINLLEIGQNLITNIKIDTHKSNSISNN